MKNNKLKLVALAIGVTFAVSCNNGEKQAEASNEATPAANENTTTNNASSEEVKVNPAHGQPGHDCAVPVGAPLNGTATNRQTPAPTNNTQSSSTVSPVRVDQTPSVNPPHGEPGHDCAVPVGAPLDKE